MPKKRKKDKILADARRIIKQAEKQRPTSAENGQAQKDHKSPKPPKSSYVYKQDHSATPKTTSIEDNQEFQSIRKDLIKTIAVSCLAIAIQIAISMYMRT